MVFMVYTTNAHSDLLANLFSFVLIRKEYHFFVLIMFLCYIFLHLILFTWNISLLICIYNFFPGLHLVINSVFACLEKFLLFHPLIVESFLKSSMEWLDGFFSPGLWRQESTDFWFSLLLLCQPVICLLNPFPINTCSLHPASLLRAHLITPASPFPFVIIYLWATQKSND